MIDSPDSLANSSDMQLEVILQRIFHEKDPVAHRAALWDLFGRSDDWELFERLHAMGAEKSMEVYFRSLLDHFDEAADASGVAADDEREEIREMYSSPLVCLHSGDLAGSAAAMHEILLNEIYEIFPINEEELPFGEATALGLRNWVEEEVLFPLSIIEFIAFSDYLTQDTNADLLENNLALMMTLFFSAQAILDLRQRANDDGLEISPI